MPSPLRANSFVSLVLIALLTRRARAQGIENAFLVSYGVLSVGAIASLTSRAVPPQVEAGTKLRVRLRGSRDWSTPVKVARMTIDSMVVQGDSMAWGFARTEIDSLQVKASTGRWAEGWLIGLIAGGATGAVIAHEAVANDQGRDWFTPGEAAVVGGVFVGVTASVVGAGIGLLAPSRWVTISGARNARVSVFPTVARPGFVARFRF